MHMGKKVTRLYEQFQPEEYELYLDVDRDAMKFSGKVTVRGKKAGRPAQRLTFHQKDLKVTSASVVQHHKTGDVPVVIKRINKQNSLNEVRLHAEGLIYPGEYTVVMEFTGVITRPMNGIYPCFFEHDGKEKKLITTQFESHHAREAFPCIDEPEAKATFDLTLVSPAGETAIANTPVKKQAAEGERQTTTFETTPIMSTYLLAFVFGELEYLEAKTKAGVAVRTYATADNVKHTQFALDVAVKCLDFYNQYFDIPYPLEKCDFIALPDFASGAMENWGCITFREQALLVDPANTSLHLKQYVANVVAHELTHQWFGNLVTMRWWTDLWLNESFASWMSWLAVDHLFPAWKVWTQFIVDEQSLALKLDALEHTHPIQVEINHPDEIRTIFDAISYEKGASVLLMLSNYLGADDFRDGLRKYLKRHAYANTESTNLWTAWEEVSGKPVGKFMGTWTSQPGYPFVSANVGKDKVELEQTRFYLNPTANKVDSIWPVPLGNGKTMTKAKETLPREGFELLNAGRSGFYRLGYDYDYVAAMDISAQDEVDRLGLLNDAFEACKAGYASSVNALKMLSLYADEDSAVVWDIIAMGIGSIRTVMDDDAVRDGLKPLVRRLTAKQLKRLGWEEKPSDSHFDKLLRPTILGLASFGEEPSVVAEAKKRFAAMKQPEDLHSDLRGVVYGTVAREGGKAEFDKLLAMHDSAANSEERVTLSGALTGFKQPELIRRALQQITSDNVRLQDAPYWIAYSFGNRHAKQLTWGWLKANWEWLQANIGNDLSFFRMPIYASRAFSDAAFLPEFKQFFGNHLSAAFERPVNQGIETIEWQAAWRDRDLDRIKEFLKA